MCTSYDMRFRDAPAVYPPRSVATEARWPIRPAALAALVDLGLSDDAIAGYCGVARCAVAERRSRYGIAATSDGRDGL